MREEPERLITEAEAAELLGLSRSSLRNDRCTNRLGIPWVKKSGTVGKRGGRVGYRPSALAAWIERRTVRA